MGAEMNPSLQKSTAGGWVRGCLDGASLAFLGIPYAAPPVREARFAAPQPVRPWATIRDATTFGPPVPQTSLPHLKAPAAVALGDEWLTLNIWTPEVVSDTALPVMVWLHGGAFLLGTSSQPDFHGKKLAAQNNVVVVTLNFRIGIEGFALIEGAPANRGLLDVVAALQWIRQNIQAFGGDPKKVTVFGQSAGALMAAALLAMPSAKGLFRRMIIQSPPGAILTRELACNVTEYFANHLGRQPTAADLSDSDPRELAAALSPLLNDLQKQAPYWGRLAFEVTPFAPVLDGEILPMTPWQALAQGAGREVELLIGHNRDEYRLFMALGKLLGTVTEEQATEALIRHAPMPDGAQAYRKAFALASPQELFERVHSDSAFCMPTLHLADAQAAGGGKVFFYELTWPSPANGGIFGACHGLDYGLVFGITSAGLPALLLGDGSNSEIETMSKCVQRLWTTFANQGDPGWEAYDPIRRLVQLIDTIPGVAPYPEERSRQIWLNHPPEAFPLLKGSPERNRS